MAIEPLAEGDVPYYHRIVADSDMDGLFGAAVLKAYRPEAEVLFSHAAAVRSGLMDELVDRSTALVDLPFHPQCGWYVDHHLTNRPSEAEASAFAQNGARNIGRTRPPLLASPTNCWPTSPICVISLP